MNMREYAEAVEATTSQFLAAVDEITEGAAKRLSEERTRLRHQIAAITADLRGDEQPEMPRAEADYQPHHRR
jgi:hypothetical protein